jgi:ribonuclease HII
MKLPLPKQQLLKIYEQRARNRGYRYIAGVDEAGRGPLAGPVVAAACILPEDVNLPGINDSKKLTSQQRERLYRQIEENPAILKSVAVVEAIIIDQVNILQATLLAMVAAIGKLSQKPDYVLVDGNRLPPLEMSAEAIIQGDTLSESIMAAAILAKVTRDRMMVEYDQIWPEYGFADHKGYPTPNHLEILKKLGPCSIHRKSYEPVKNVSVVK